MSNCYQNGFLPVELDNTDVAHIMTAALAGDGYEVTVDLEAQEVRDGSGWTVQLLDRCVPASLLDERPGRHRAYAHARE